MMSRSEQDCRCYRHAGFDPAANLGLRALQSGWASHPDPDDLPDPFEVVPVIDPDGMVQSIRPRSLTELLDDIESWVEGEVE